MGNLTENQIYEMFNDFNLGKESKREVLRKLGNPPEEQAELNGLQFIRLESSTVTEEVR